MITVDALPEKHPVITRRWITCLAVVLGLHTVGVWLLLHHTRVAELSPPAPEAIMLDLPPPAAAPPQPLAVAPAPPPPPPPAPTPEPVQEPPLALPPDPPVSKPEVTLPASAPRRTIPPRPVVRHPRPPARNLPMQLPTATPAIPAPPPTAAAASPPSAPTSLVSNAVPGWRGELVSRLQRAKRYPDIARSRGDQGVVVVTFTMDRNGHVLSASVVRSSGVSELDGEALAMIQRAEPLPAVPAELPSNTITLTVPVTFSLR